MIILDSKKYYNLGNVSMINDINGTVSQYIEYISYGEEMYSAHRNTYNTPYRYTAKELDEETGLYYYGARYYNPKLSIWLSVDPMVEKYISHSPYNYVMNNPIKYIDPDGRENIPALIWAAKNIANKGIISDYYRPWFGNEDNRWTYKKGEIPTRLVCYESAWISYMNGADAATMKILETGFTNKNKAFNGRSYPAGGMNWFKNGDGTNRKFETDITKGELGDIVFMGETADMKGHAVLLASDITMGTIEIDGTSVETATFYSLSTSSNTDQGSFGGREFTFLKQKDGSWKQQGGLEYKFNGFGQMTNIQTTDEQKQEVKTLIEDVKNGN